MNLFVLNLERLSLRAVSRHLWMLRAGDQVISPLPVNADNLDYVSQMLGFDPNTISVVAGDQLLTDDYLTTGFADLPDRLARPADGRQRWKVVPLMYTPGIAELAEQLGLPLDPALLFAAQRGPILLNRKSHFRQLAVALGMPIADGSVVDDVATLTKTLRRHLPRTGTVIVKRDDSNGGRGNITVSTSAPAPQPGARESWQAKDDLHLTASDLWAALTDEQCRTLVVEAYHDATHCFYFEFLIDERGIPALLSSGTFRRDPDPDPSARQLAWTGLDLPADLPTTTAANAMLPATQMVTLAARMGYRGYINVDAILTRDGGLIFNEVNARWGGGLALDAVGRGLLGANYADDHVLSSARDIPAMPLASAVKTLRDHGLHYTPESQEGVVVVGYDETLAQPLECAVIAADRPRARAVEAGMRTVMAAHH